LVVDLLTTVFPFGSEPFVRLREQMWTSVFADAARAGTSLIFTFAPESTVAHGSRAESSGPCTKPAGVCVSCGCWSTQPSRNDV
jgi:hypothetical protein